MKLTADNLAQEIRQHHKHWASMTDTAQAAALIPFIERHIAGQQGVIAEYIAARDDYEAATKPPNSHALPRVVSHGDLRVLRYREARTALATRSPQPAKTYALDEILDDLGPEHRAKVEKRFEELLADYNSQEPVSSSTPAKPAGAVHIFGVDLASGPDQQVEARVEDGKIVGMTIRDGYACAVPMPEPDETEDTGDGYITNWYSRNSLVTYGNAREPAAEGATHWEESASYLLDRCKHSVRVREGGGPENLLSSLIVTFMGMEQKLAIRAAPAVNACPECGKVGVICKKPTCAMLSLAAEPAVEAFGTVYGYRRHARTVEIILDVGVPRWMIFDKTRVTISPTGGKSDV